MSKKFSHCSRKLSTLALSQDLPKTGNSRRTVGQAQNEDEPAPTAEVSDTGVFSGNECFTWETCIGD